MAAESDDSGTPRIEQPQRLTPRLQSNHVEAMVYALRCRIRQTQKQAEEVRSILNAQYSDLDDLIHHLREADGCAMMLENNWPNEFEEAYPEAD